ncbi:hypothetical protein JND48_14840 [Listeria monocytogenes]|nr:hypothetical protein [Listeria monocytogenes]
MAITTPKARTTTPAKAICRPCTAEPSGGAHKMRGAPMVGAPLGRLRQKA